MLEYWYRTCPIESFYHTSSKREPSLSDNLRASFSSLIAELLRFLNPVSPSPDKK